MVVAESRYVAEDAAELVDVDYEPLEAVATLEQAGFVRERGFMRMSLGDDPALARTAPLHAVAGPEFG